MATPTPSDPKKPTAPKPPTTPKPEPPESPAPWPADPPKDRPEIERDPDVGERDPDVRAPGRQLHYAPASRSTWEG